MNPRATRIKRYTARLDAADGRILPLRPKNDGRVINPTSKALRRVPETLLSYFEAGRANYELTRQVPALDLADQVALDFANAFEQLCLVGAALQQD
jgi:hypothetical protein